MRCGVHNPLPYLSGIAGVFLHELVPLKILLDATPLPFYYAPDSFSSNKSTTCTLSHRSCSSRTALTLTTDSPRLS
jgi:hypothetical protein